MTQVTRLLADPATRRRITIGVVAFLLFAWVFLYRFNTLGGSLGGFDNDHFLYMTLAKQVQAGEQPLRDFMDGVHGARPSLTYELSAGAQRLFGNNLRSEALLTVGGVAFGATITFLAGSVLTPWPWALSTALVSALLSPKLYGYPKVLVTAVAASLIISYARRPSWALVAAMSAWSAAAFLFRHDYIVYCAIGFFAIIVLTGNTPWRTRVTRVIAYGLMTTLLMAPSLWWIERYRGIREYVRNSLEMSRNEVERTEIGWPVMTFDGGLSPVNVFKTDENAEAWLYYLFLSVPVLVVALDQLTKWLVRTRVPLHSSVEVIPNFLDITHVRNTGAAFGFLNAVDFPGKTIVIAVIAICALIGVSLYAGTLTNRQVLPRLAMALIIGGAAGNLIDRMFVGSVVDFVDAYWGSFHFWAFNVADSAITVGVALMILDMIGTGTHASNPV